MKTTFLVTLAALLLIVTNAFAFTVPTPTGFVTDTTGVIPPGQLQALNTKLANYKAKSQNEIAVVMVPTLGGEELADVGQKIFETYKIGQAGLDNGVLLLIALKDHKMRLQTGKGVEGEITDIQSSEILDSLKPFFRANNFAQGVDVATTKMMVLLDSRKGQKPDQGTGQQFNHPVVDPDAKTPSHSCDVSNSTADAGMGDGGVAFLIWFGLILLALWLWNRSALRARKLRERQSRFVQKPSTIVNEIVSEPIYVPEPYVAPVVAPAVQAAQTAAFTAGVIMQEKLDRERRERERREERTAALLLQEEMDQRAAERRRLRQRQEQEEAAAVVPVLVPVNRYETYEVEQTVNPVWVDPAPVDDAPVYETPIQNDSVQVDDSPSYDSGSNDDSSSSDGGGFDGGDSGGGGADSSW